MNMRRRIMWGILLLQCATLIFTNCSLVFRGYSANENAGNLPFSHPSLERLASIQEVSIKANLMSRHQVYSHLKAIFDSESLSANVRNYIQAVLNFEILGRASYFGEPCDFANPLYTNYPSADCRFENSNASVDQNIDATVTREASRVQACLRILSNDEVISQLRTRVQSLAKVPHSNATGESLEVLFEMFFPGQSIPNAAKSDLLDLYENMTVGLESVNDRWRMIALTFCELPDWQYL